MSKQTYGVMIVGKEAYELKFVKATSKDNAKSKFKGKTVVQCYIAEF